jgi:two-component system, cell cycle sensor histidine kinase and response regulator CckA
MPLDRTGILLVDDESVDLVVMQGILEKAGYVVFAGMNHEHALALLMAHLTEINLLLTDVSLPGKTGLDIASDCLQYKPELKILFVSGWTGAEFLKYVGIPGDDLHFLAKPFRASQLLSRVRTILGTTEQIGWLNAKRGKASAGDDV